ncbi:hypothetical protein K7432_010891 [Basidiobolus ranarum]|uniref:F-box domain-containing protein n=1 Tax=Basidiobolus ranarum TaxID=34480 RepID=A0ABR2VV75_9FUNG
MLLRLSPELITLIFSHLEHERLTLHSLLTVNKLLFNIVTPILYRNPFRSCFWRNHPPPKPREILYLLLASSDLLSKLIESTTKTLQWDFTDWDPPSAPFTVNYLDYYTEIYHLEWESNYEPSFSYMIGDFGHVINMLFCKYNAEKIKSICLPIFNVKPYLPIVRRMSSLQRIEFCGAHNDEVIHTNGRNIVIIEDAIEFVKTHVDTFNDTLTEIMTPDLIDLERNGIQSDIQIEDLIKILIQPQVIEVNDSYQFCQYLSSRSTDRLRVFRGPFIFRSHAKPDWDSSSLFQRCPKLEKIRFSPTRPNSFRWAVEKHDLHAGSDFISSSMPNIKLAPLQDVDMMCKYCPALPIVQDIVYAFRKTIKSIKVLDNKTIEHNPEPLYWDWLLPNLVKIHISGADLSLFDFGSLNLCPSLEELYLTDKYVYLSSNNVIEYGPVLKLPKLRKVQLEFGISSKFNFASLKHSPLLETLIIYEAPSSLLIRPMDAPCWTWRWNWNLPYLKNLYLTGESAFLFQFCLMDSCPSLQCLSLNTESHQRSLSLDEMAKIDLLLPLEDSNQTRLGNSTSDKFKFSLHGKWEFSGETLSVLLQRYMSHVTEIHLSDTKGLTALDIINATQKLPLVQNVYSHLCFDVADIQQIGLDLKNFSEHGTGTIGSVNYSMRG